MPGISPDQLAQLAAPFAPEAVHWRAQAVANGKALALAYLDARDVQDRLDGVCGAENWQDRYEETPKGRIIATLSINVDGEWISKSDGAGDTDVEGEKGALSDALKRSAVKWGIGRYLYSMPNVWVPCEVGQNGKFKKFTEDPWKHVRGFSPPAPTAAPFSTQKILDEIEACDTQITLQRWWKNNETRIPDAYIAGVVAAVNARKAQIGTMDMARTG